MNYEPVCHHWETYCGDDGPPVERELVVPALLRLIGDVQGRRVLDAACGNGHLTWKIAKAGASVAGVDLSMNLLGYAHGRAKRHGVEIDFRQADVAELPFEDETFDAVVCANALPDVRRYELAISEMTRVLAPRGTLVISLPHPCFALSDEENSCDETRAVDYFAREHRRFPIIIDGKPSGVWFSSERRTLADYLNAFAAAGLRLVSCEEPLPSAQLAESDPHTWGGMARVPQFLILVFVRILLEQRR